LAKFSDNDVKFIKNFYVFACSARPGAMRLNWLLYLFQRHAFESALLSQYVGLGQG
jgi:hypothetical protein